MATTFDRHDVPPILDLSDACLEAVRKAVTQEVIDNFKEWFDSEDGEGVTISLQSEEKPLPGGEEETVFTSPLTLCFQIDLADDIDIIRRIDVEKVVDYELAEGHPDEIALVETLAVELERIAAKARARVEEIKRLAPTDWRKGKGNG